jgi:hypothetical protein
MDTLMHSTSMAWYDGGEGDGDGVMHCNMLHRMTGSHPVMPACNLLLAASATASTTNQPPHVDVHVTASNLHPPWCLVLTWMHGGWQWFLQHLPVQGSVWGDGQADCSGLEQIDHQVIDGAHAWVDGVHKVSIPHEICPVVSIPAGG